MPPPIKLPEEAREELPGAKEKVSKYRGTFVWWVVVVLYTSLLFYQRALIQDKDKQIENGQLREAKKDKTIEQKQQKIDSINGLFMSLYFKQKATNQEVQKLKEYIK